LCQIDRFLLSLAIMLNDAIIFIKHHFPHMTMHFISVYFLEHNFLYYSTAYLKLYTPVLLTVYYVLRNCNDVQHNIKLSIFKEPLLTFQSSDKDLSLVKFDLVFILFLKCGIFYFSFIYRNPPPPQYKNNGFLFSKSLV
jgi:hypothetical protein